MGVINVMDNAHRRAIQLGDTRILHTIGRIDQPCKGRFINFRCNRRVVKRQVVAPHLPPNDPVVSYKRADVQRHMPAPSSLSGMCPVGERFDKGQDLRRGLSGANFINNGRANNRAIGHGCDIMRILRGANSKAHDDW